MPQKLLLRDAGKQLLLALLPPESINQASDVFIIEKLSFLFSETEFAVSLQTNAWHTEPFEKSKCFYITAKDSRGRMIFSHFFVKHMRQNNIEKLLGEKFILMFLNINFIIFYSTVA